MVLRGHQVKREYSHRMTYTTRHPGADDHRSKFIHSPIGILCSIRILGRCSKNQNWPPFRGILFMVLNFTFNNISVMSLVADSFHGGGNRSTRRTPPSCCKSPTSFITQCCIKYTSPWSGFKLNWVVVVIDCICSCKSNYHTTTMVSPPFTGLH